ncbi:hypothetical protein [Microbacterium sp. NPDC077486]
MSLRRGAGDADPFRDLHHCKVPWRAVIVSLVMRGIGILMGSVPFFVAQ